MSLAIMKACFMKIIRNNSQSLQNPAASNWTCYARVNIDDVLFSSRAVETVRGLWVGQCPVCGSKYSTDNYRPGRYALRCSQGCTDTSITAAIVERESIKRMRNGNNGKIY